MSTVFEFTCPSCAAPGKARSDWAGRSVRCKHCKAVFVLPTPGEAAADAYDLAEPIPQAPDLMAVSSMAEAGGSTFSPSYRDAPMSSVVRNRDRPAPKKPVTPREELREWRGDLRVRILAGVLIVGVVLTLLTFAIPGLGHWGGLALVTMGLILVAIGFFVGAYAAFCEDLLHGMAYVFFPIYTGYYLVTRFDDLWPFFAGSTLGFLMFLAGTRALAMSGAV